MGRDEEGTTGTKQVFYSNLRKLGRLGVLTAAGMAAVGGTFNDKKVGEEKTGGISYLPKTGEKYFKRRDLSKVISTLGRTVGEALWLILTRLARNE